jgi:hypothetical protein
MLGRWVVAVLCSLCALQPAAHVEEGPPKRYHGHRVGTGYIAFYIGNRTDDWGCLGSVHVHNDDQPAPRGAGQPGQPSGIFSSVWAPTPLWQLNLSSGCHTADSSVSAGEAVVLQSCSVQCERRYLASSPGDGPSAVLRWEGCVTGLPAAAGEVSPATVDVEVTIDVVGNVSTWGATVGARRHPGTAASAGLCLQSVTLPDMRTLRMTPQRELLCAPSSEFARPDGHNRTRGGGCTSERGGSGGKDRLLWVPNSSRAERGPGMSFTAWLSAPVGTPGAVGLYVGSHSQRGHPKGIMPMQCLGGGNAGLQAVHLPPMLPPSNKQEAPTSHFNYTIPYPVVVTAFCGDGGGSADERRARSQRRYTCLHN